MTDTSEFGKGFTYCLGLFLAHAERFKDDPDLWFHAAADHLMQFDAENAPASLRGRCIGFRSKCCNFRFSIDGEDPTKEDVFWAVQEAKDILREYDLLNGFDAIKGEWE